MGKVLWDLECRNPECEDPTRLNDARAETRPDGTVVMESADGKDVEAVCETCHGKLSKVLGKVNIGGKSNKGDLSLILPIEIPLDSSERGIIERNGSGTYHRAISYPIIGTGRRIGSLFKIEKRPCGSKN